MNVKKLILNSIEHNYVEKIPTMYRADPEVNMKLIKYFKLNNIKNDWEELIQKLGADNFSDGETFGAFTNYFPKYIGPNFNSVFEMNHFFIWGIKPIEVKVGGTTDVVFHKNPPLYNFDNVSDILNYSYPKIEWFDFSTFKIATDAVYQDFYEQDEVKAKDLKNSEKYFLGTNCMNSLFMTSIFIRGIDKMMVDLITNNRYAEILIGNIGEYMLEFCERNLGSIGNVIDMYGIWDDFATQDGLMISADTWRKYYKPWDKKIIEVAKKYDLYVCFHICGNCVEIIPDLIEMGVDILDPVQVSAKNMRIDNLKILFGKDICFHGGLDAQRLIPLGKPDEIKKEVSRIKKLYGNEGGIILGPSHYITADTPIENILAIYR